MNKIWIATVDSERERIIKTFTSSQEARTWVHRTIQNGSIEKWLIFELIAAFKAETRVIDFPIVNNSDLKS